MSDLALHLYHRLPPVARSLVATMRGAHLRRWRYGPETERLVAEALEREQWSPDQWRRWREESLARLLHRAATRVPYYRDHWATRKRAGDHTNWEELANWPIIEKRELREHPEAFLADDCDPRQMFEEHTSGTSGQALTLWWSRETVRRWYALFEARWRRWYGISRDDRWAIFGGQLVTPVGQARPPFWVWNVPLHQLYMSCHHISPATIPAYVDALRRYRVRYLWGYPSALYAVAAHMKPGELPMSVVVTNAEPLYDYQRSAIAEAFQCEVRETYGQSEAVTAASECESGYLHLWPEVGVTEVLSATAASQGNEVGDLVCTGLLNQDMPLIRYRVGDRGVLSSSAEPCACGRRLPRLASVEGRIDDVLITADGRWIGRLDTVFKDRLPVQEAQIVQEALDRVRIKYVPAADYTERAGLSMVQRLRDRLGPIDVLLEAVDTIPRTAAGKFRAVVCNLPPHERHLQKVQSVKFKVQSG